MGIASEVGLVKVSGIRLEEGLRTMLIASVVLPEIAMLIPATQAHDLVAPCTVACFSKTGPPPPAVCTAQPSKAKAAMIATTDLTKKSQRILRGWIKTKGSCTIHISRIGSRYYRTLTDPEDKIRDELVTGQSS